MMTSLMNHAPLVAATAVVFILAQPANAQYYYYDDNGLSSAARIGTGIAIAIAFCLLIAGLVYSQRRRRLKRQAAVAVPPPPGGYHQHPGANVNYGYTAYPQGSFQGYATQQGYPAPPGAEYPPPPQYPAEAHTGAEPYYAPPLLPPPAETGPKV